MRDGGYDCVYTLMAHTHEHRAISILSPYMSSVVMSRLFEIKSCLVTFIVFFKL